MKLISELKIVPPFSEDKLQKSILKKLKLPQNALKTYEIVKMGIDARRKMDVKIVINVAVSVKVEFEKMVKDLPDIIVDHSGLYCEKVSGECNPVIVGFGPSGMFAGLALALAGLKPIILEQGECVGERVKTVEDFWKKGKLNPHSNVQFGEGGAGTFSDGKLNTSLNNLHCKKVINELILNGAPKEIFYKNKAHIGTDNLRQIVPKIREKIIKNGGKIIFNANFLNFELKNNNICAINYLDLKTNKQIKIKTNCLILAVGHSARDVFKMLKDNNVKMHKKPFAMGVRIEMPQKVVDVAQYGKENEHLPPADFKLVEHLPNGRSVFSFCMCPGGQVVASSSEYGTIVTNGMSNFDRAGEFANSALLVNVTPEDFEGEDVLSGLMFQEKYEKIAFELAGKTYSAPCQKVGDFLGQNLNDKKVNCTYRPGVTYCDIKKCLPEFVSESLKMAIPLLNKKLKGMAEQNNLLIAPETRSSCPVQLNREQDYSCTYSGLYAVGEGAGFAGGIISSAVDGLKCAEKIIDKLIQNSL